MGEEEKRNCPNWENEDSKEVEESSRFFNIETSTIETSTIEVSSPEDKEDEYERDLEENPDGEEEEDTYPQVVFDDWMLTLTRDQRKKLSVVLYESFCNRQKMSKMDAAQEAASITGVSVTKCAYYYYITCMSN